LDKKPVKNSVSMSSIPAEKIMPEPSYSADDIAVLSGLEAVRRRPGMYAGNADDRPAADSREITSDDVREGLTGVVSGTMDDWPRFGGAARARLASPDVHPVVQNAASEAFAAWLATHPNDANAIVQNIAASARRREAGEQLARISSE
jgi:DNA gyrase/topoisomerase IV subunit B